MAIKSLISQEEEKNSSWQVQYTLIYALVLAVICTRKRQVV